MFSKCEVWLGIKMVYWREINPRHIPGTAGTHRRLNPSESWCVGASRPDLGHFHGPDQREITAKYRAPAVAPVNKTIG